jgi:hypothetical protein
MTEACMNLHDWADATVIATTLFAVLAYLRHRWKMHRKRVKLETYLRKVKEKDKAVGKKGQHSIYHLVSKLELTQDEIIEASFDSEHIAIRRKTGADGSHLAKDLLFEYVEKKEEIQPESSED